MTDWTDLTVRTLEELDTVSDTYRPTNFWGPGVQQLLEDMEERGLERFKSWPSSSIWFYPLYGNGWTEARQSRAWDAIEQIHPNASRAYFNTALNGWHEARRDIDVARAFWDQDRWPFDLDAHGENPLGQPWQRYRINDDAEPRFGRAYANYLLLLAALSRHVEEVPRSFLEIGGGFGVLGEIVMQRDEQARYLDLDIPPLLTVASYYLTELFGEDRVRSYDPSAAQDAPLGDTHSGALPNYAIERVTGDFDVFVNSFSFQEMEPDVVDHYIDQVCAKGIRYAVSMNSRLGKPKAARAGDWGALQPVRSANIIEMFERRGLKLVGQYDAPLVRSAGQVNVFRRA